MKKRYKILIFIIFLSNIISILNFTGFCFREFKYLNDDEILKNFLDSAALNRINYDDNGGLPPKFYFIEENPTNYEILKTLKYIVNNDINKTITTKRYFYDENLVEIVTTGRLNIFEALGKYYTIKDVTYEVDLGGTIKNGRYVYRYADLPINQAFIIMDSHNFIAIYGKDAFFIEKHKKYVRSGFFIIKKSYFEFENYDIKGNDRIPSIGSGDLERFIYEVSRKFENYKNGLERYNFTKINNCGATKERL